MAGEATQSPFDLLSAIDVKSRSHAVGLPSQEEAKEEWTGVLFRLRDTELLAPMSEVAEIVSVPDIAGVPGVKPWVLGIANMRGSLLPVIDLQGFLFGKNSEADAKFRRLLVVNHQGVFAGLLVDAIIGMKHFWQDDRAEELPSLDEAFAPYVDVSYSSLGEHYGVFSFWRLARSDAFMDVAI